MKNAELLYADCRDMKKQEISDFWLERIPFGRLEKFRNLKNEEEKGRSLAASALFVLALERAGIPKDSTVVIGSHGKPVLADYPGFHYNLTHAGNYAAIVTATVPCGVDIETAGRASSKLIRRFFLPEEQPVFDQLLADGAKDPATRLWTLKEAGMKMTGEGLTGRGAKTVIVKNSGGFVLMKEKQIIGYFAEYNEIQGMRLSVCLENQEFPLKARPVIFDSVESFDWSKQ